MVFDTIAAAKARGCDVVICDTAGRLHNKKNLMDELGKISRIIDRELPGCDRETLLVLDAATGQNAVNQAREFQSAAGITGIVLTKLDGTPKGGVVLPIKRDLGLSVKFIGVGEQVDDLQPFDAAAFADALFDTTGRPAPEEAPAIQEEWGTAAEKTEETDTQWENEPAEEPVPSIQWETEEQPLTGENLLQDIQSMLGGSPAAGEGEPSPEESQSEEPSPEELPLEEPQPEKKKRRFWPFGRKRDEE